MGSDLATPDYVAHIHHGLTGGLKNFLEIGWAMTRIVENGVHSKSASLDAYIADHLPLAKARAYDAGSAWRAVAALLRATGHPMDQSDDWDACSLASANVLPALTDERALVFFRRVIEQPVPLMLQVWARSVQLSQLTDTKELTAGHVKKAMDELLAPAKLPTAKPESAADVSRETEESAAELSDRAVGHLTRQVRDTCQQVPLIPEVATAIVEGVRLREIANEVDSAKQHLEAILDREICSQLETERVLSLLAEAKRKLMFGKPFAPCPHCWQVGRTTGNCTGCQPSTDSKPLGWVNRNKWGSAGEQTRKGPP